VLAEKNKAARCRRSKGLISTGGSDDGRQQADDAGVRDVPKVHETAENKGSQKRRMVGKRLAVLTPRGYIPDWGDISRREKGSPE